jgi:hypothetical protein
MDAGVKAAWVHFLNADSLTLAAGDVPHSLPRLKDLTTWD